MHGAGVGWGTGAVTSQGWLVTSGQNQVLSCDVVVWWGYDIRVGCDLIKLCGDINMLLRLLGTL